MKTNLYILLFLFLSSCASRNLYQTIPTGHKSFSGIIDSVYTTTFTQKKPQASHALTWIKVNGNNIHCCDNKYKKGDTVVNLKVKRLVYQP